MAGGAGKAGIPPWLAYALFVIVGLVWSSLYALSRWDGLHWGSVIVHSLGICEGRAPYSDVPIFYGPVPFYLFCAIGSLTAFSNLVFALVTFAAYASTILAWLLIAGILRFDWKSRTAFVVVAALFHPFVVYPWYDYIGGAFLGWGTLVVVGSRGRSLGAALLTAGLFAAAALSRVTYAPIVIVALALFPLLRVITWGAAALIVGAGAVWAAVFSAAMWLGYGLTPADILLITVENVGFIAGSRNPLRGLIVWPGSTPPWFFFLVCGVVGGLYLVDRIRLRSMSRPEVALYLVAVVGLFCNAHILSFFRMITASPFILLLAAEAVVRTWPVLVRNGNPFRARPLVICGTLLVFVPAIIGVANAVVSYPYGTAGFRIGNLYSTAAFAGSRINGVTFHSSAQREFYRTVNELCAGKALLNQTSDVIIARMCGDKPIVVHDWLYETSTSIIAKQPELIARLSGPSPRLREGEILFSYLPQIEGLNRIAILTNEDQDFHNLPISVYLAE